MQAFAGSSGSFDIMQSFQSGGGGGDNYAFEGAGGGLDVARRHRTAAASSLEGCDVCNLTSAAAAALPPWEQGCSFTKCGYKTQPQGCRNLARQRERDVAAAAAAAGKAGGGRAVAAAGPSVRPPLPPPVPGASM